MLTWILGGVFAYLFAGYSIGKLVGGEFLNNHTPTEKLGFWGKAKRRILFPYMYKFWGERAQFSHNSDSTYLCAYLISHRIDGRSGCLECSFDSEGLEKYAWFSAFVWVWRPVWIAIFVSGYLGKKLFERAFKMLGFVFSLPEHIASRFSKKTTDAVSFEDETVAFTLRRLTEFKEKEIGKQREDLVETERLASRRKGRIAEGRSRIERLFGEFSDSEHNAGRKKRCQALLEQFMAAEEQENQNIAKFKEMAVFLKENEREFEKEFELLDMYRLADELNLSARSEMNSTLQTMVGLMESCRKISSAISAVETNLICKTDLPIEILEEQVVEERQQARKMQAEMERRLNLPN